MYFIISLGYCFLIPLCLLLFDYLMVYVERSRKVSTKLTSQVEIDCNTIEKSIANDKRRLSKMNSGNGLCFLSFCFALLAFCFLGIGSSCPLCGLHSLCCLLTMTSMNN